MPKCPNCGHEWRPGSSLRQKRRAAVLAALRDHHSIRAISEATGVPTTAVRNLILELRADGLAKLSGETGVGRNAHAYYELTKEEESGPSSGGDKGG